VLPRDKLVLFRDELDASGQRLDVSISSNGYHPVREMALVDKRRDFAFGEGTR
jgi:hypothetical protein